MKTTTTLRLQLAGLLQTIHRSKSIVSKIHKPKAIAQHILLILLCLVTLAGAKGWAQTNNALQFTQAGSNYISVPHDAALNLNGGDFTLEAWVYNLDGTDQTIMSKGNGGGLANQDVYIFAIDGNKIALQLGNTSVGSETFQSNTNVPLNAWVHVAAVYNSGTQTVTFYLNGVADGGGTYANTLYNADTNPMYIGRQGTTCNCNFFDGQIDELRIWNDQRTQKELSLNMNNPLAGSEANLVAYYPFNEGVANGNNTALTTVFDATSNNFNGTLTNFTKTGTNSNLVAGFTAVNNALDFDGGNDYVEVASPFTGFTNEITVEAWINLDNIDAGGDGIITQGALNSDDMSTNVFLVSDNGSQDGRLTFYINDGMTWRTATSTTVLEGTGWHHVACVANTTGTYIYIDGVLENTGTGISSGIQSNGTARLRLGDDVRINGGRFTDVALDEVRIWNVARTCAQIKATKDVELTGSETNLVAYYNFNYGTAAGTNTGITTLPDLSTNTNNGTLNGFTLSGATTNWVSGSGNNVSGNSPVLQPEINVQANGNDILTTSTTISTDRNTFFPFTAIGANMSQTFTLQNTGAGNLSISSATSSDAQFTISSLSNLTAGNNTTFTITYAPTTSGVHTSTITINNNDCDEAAYTFQVRGTSASGNANALDFDGTDDYITLAANSAFDFTNNCTIETWFYRTNSTDNDCIFSVRSLSAFSGNNTRFSIHARSNNDGFGIYNGTDFTTVNYTLTNNTWYHVAFAYNSGTWTVYVNGQNVGTIANTINTGGASLPVSWGISGGLASEFWTGRLDEMRVWNTTRTQDEVIANMNQQLSGSETGLVAYYLVNQGITNGNNTTETTVYDVSVNSFGATLTNYQTGTPSTSLNEGTTSNYVAGFTKINNALSFNGTTDYVATGLNLPAGDFTMEAWIQYEGTVGANFQPIIASVNQEFFIGKNNGNTDFGIQDSDYKTNTNSNNAFDGNWHHIAVTRSGTTISVYVDGVFAYSDTFTGATASTLNIGNEPEGGGYFFTGKIDEVRIWSTVRTCAEINAYKGIELMGIETGLLAYYNFNHGVAAGNNTTLTNLPDISTNSNTGTLTDFAGLDGSVNSGQTSNWVDASANNVSGNTPANQPEINIKGGSTPTTIADGDGVPETGDDTDFQSVFVGASKTVTYTIENTGTADLAITSIALSGVGMGDYSLGTLPTSVAAGGTATFDVTFTPSSVATDIAAIVTINNADCDEAAYDFAIQGDGGQAAPGGVTSGLRLWLKANAGVTGTTAITQWNDQSGNSSNATSGTGPELITSGLNFNPVLSFDQANSELMTITGGIFAGNTFNDVNIFLLGRTKSINNSQAFYEGLGASTNEKISVHLPFSDNNIYWDAGDIGGINARLSIAWGGNVSDSYIWSFNHSTTSTPDGNKQDIRRNGQNIANDATATSFTGNNEDFFIASDESSSAYWDGNLGELITYTATLTAAQQQRIESYIALKYGVTLDQTSARDYLASDGTTKIWDATAGAAYLNSIAGIGRDDASALNQKQSKSINSGAALTIGLGTVAADNASNTNTFAADKKFMTWGHNNLSTDYSAGVDAGVPNAGIDKRIARVWQVQDGGVGTVQIKFDVSQFSNFTATTAGEFALLVDDDGTDFSNAAIVIAGDLSGNVVTFSNIKLDGATKYISLGQWKGSATSGEKGSYLTCNGTDQYVSTASLVTTARTNFTVEMWFQWDGTGSGDRTLFHNGDKGSNNGYGLTFDGTNLVPLVDGNKVANTTTTIVANTWYHVALVGDGTNLKLYLNGKEETLASTALPATTPATGTSIGAEGTGTNVFVGKIEEVRFWNVTRTEAQIREYIHLTLNGSESGIVAYYQFNASSGDAVDAIAGNNGTLQNSATRTTSDCPVGIGLSVTNSITASGNQTFSNGVAINFAAGVLPQGDVVVTQLYGVSAPTNIPTGITTYPSAYWVVRNYGANSSFTELTQIEFTIPTSNSISTDDETTPSNIGLYKRASNSGIGDAWTFMGGATTANASAQTITFATFSNEFTSFSQLLPGTINSGTSGLPVTLGNFEAVRQDNNRVLVRWETISEHDNAGFEVQKSENGTDYKILGFVDGIGNSNQKHSYQFTDAQASRSAYYRLKQIDQDGKFRYSPVKFVQGIDIQTLRVYPNPFTHELKLDLGGKGVTQLPMYVELYSAQGKRTLQYRGKLQQVQNAINQHIGTLKQGVYVLRVIVGNRAYIERIMKQ